MLETAYISTTETAHKSVHKQPPYTGNKEVTMVISFPQPHPAAQNIQASPQDI